MKLNKRFLALLLAVTMMLGMLPVFAAAEDAPTCTCGTETGEHTTECALYQAPAEPTCTCGTETGEHTTECALYKAPEAPVCTCGTETDEHTTECALYTEPTQPEKTFAQSLLELTSMEALYTALLAEENAASVQALSVAEVEALLDHNSALYAAIAEPADQDNTYLAGIVNCLVAVPAYVNRETEPTCTCGTETDEHTTECALYEEPTCTCGTETGEHTTECALYEEPTCTCGTETEEHTDGCPLYVCVDCGKNPCECVVTPGVNFSNAAPLVSPVAKQSKLKTMFNFFKSTKEVTTTGKDVQGLETKKSVNFDPETGIGTLTLEAWATGEKVTTEVVHAQPVDVVLVLDQSDSMKKCVGCDQYESRHDSTGDHVFQSRADALKGVLRTFVTDLYADAAASGMDHRLAMVAFGSRSGNETITPVMRPGDDAYNRSSALRTTAVLTYDNPSDPSPDIPTSPKTYIWQHYLEYKENSTIRNLYLNDTYSKYFHYAMHSLADKDQSFFYGAINSYLSNTNGGTQYDYGIMMADRVLSDNSNVEDNDNRKKVVIFFSDGQPEGTTGDTAIEYAKSLKNDGVTIYTVGLLMGADGSNPGNLPTGSTAADVANRTLHRLSSNYNGSGTLNSELNGKSYYLSATNASGLTAAFKGITEEISSGGASTTLNASAVVKDVISDYFLLPDGVTQENIKNYVNVYTPDYAGNDTFEAIGAGNKVNNPSVTLGSDGKTISVTNFDFAGNWVGEEILNGEVESFHGKKLVIQIQIKVREGFLGGIKVPTNADGSGVYENANATETLEDFISPTVGVPVPELTVTANDMMVKYGSEITAEQLRGNVSVLIDGKTWGEYEDWQKAYLQEPEVVTNPESFDSVTARTTYTATATLKYLDDTVADTAEDTGNIYIEKTAGALKTDKSAEFNQTTKTGTLTLEAWATGESITTTNTTSVPLDIILVLDLSDSMKDCMCGANNPKREHKISDVEGNDNCTIMQSRIDALMNATKGFVDSVYQDAAGPDNNLEAMDDNINHRIAIVGFGSQAQFIAGTTAQSALVDVSQTEGRNSIDNALDHLANRVSGSTNMAAGLSYAHRIFNVDEWADQGRNRVVILFSDGQPDGPDEFTDKESLLKGTYNPSIAQSLTLKQTDGATVYTIGIFDDADAADYRGAKSMANKFMHLLSSGFPNADCITNNVTEKSNYYLSAGDTASLNNVFTGISQEITSGGSNIQLGTGAVLKDVLTEQFELPGNVTASDIEVYTANYTDENTFSTEREPLNNAVVTIDDKTVTVSGFDYSENWVGKRTSGSTTTYRGKKLIVEIPFVVRDGFLGGNGVPTNDDGSGIYLDDQATETLEDFVSPEVNVPIGDIAIAGLTDKNVYLMGGLTKDQILAGVSVTSGGKGIYDVEDWKKEFVNITTIEPEALTNLTDDTTATYTVTIAPKNTSTDSDAVGAKTGSATVKVNVFKPTVTFQDGTVKYMNHLSTATYTNPVSTVWKHGTTLATPEIMTGDEPTLTFAYAAQSGVTDGKVTATDHVPMDVTSVKIVDTDVTTHVFFDHQACNPVCAWNGNDESEFWLHVTDTVGSLTITKSGVEREDEGAPFVFKITKDDFAMEVVVYGNSSVTIENLPVGTYTVKEITGYWRYTLASEQNADVGGGITKKVTFNNTLGIHKWLDDWANATNHFGS